MVLDDVINSAFLPKDSLSESCDSMQALHSKRGRELLWQRCGMLNQNKKNILFHCPSIHLLLNLIKNRPQLRKQMFLSWILRGIIGWNRSIKAQAIASLTMTQVTPQFWRTSHKEVFIPGNINLNKSSMFTLTMIEKYLVTLNTWWVPLEFHYAEICFSYCS